MQTHDLVAAQRRLNAVTGGAERARSELASDAPGRAQGGFRPASSGRSCCTTRACAQSECARRPR